MLYQITRLSSDNLASLLSSYQHPTYTSHTNSHIVKHTATDKFTHTHRFNFQKVVLFNQYNTVYILSILYINVKI